MSVKNKSFLVSDNDVFLDVNLTVSESKRLIAKGIINMPLVKDKLQKGMIIITKGSTNSYIAEELMKKTIEHGSFLLGHFIPAGKEALNIKKNHIKEIVFENGKLIDISYSEALRLLKPGDLVLKGGNLLNYSRKQAAVCIGAYDGGTTHKFLPYVGENKATLVIPIGLEKETSLNLEDSENVLNANNERLGSIPKLYLFKTGMIFTEIEAIQQYANVKVFLYGLGGLSGREGGISFIVVGTKEEIIKVKSFIQTIKGEPPF